MPLSTPLENGQRVEIITAKEGNPSVNWLYEGWVKSNRAISKIRAYIRQQNADTVREEGRAQLDKQLSKIFPKPNLQALAEKLGFKRAIVPKANMPRNEKEFPNLKIFGVSSLQEAIEICRDAEN